MKSEIIIDGLKSADTLHLFNETRWGNKIKTLQYLGYNVYSWIFDERIGNDPIKNLIPAPNGGINWKDWIDENRDGWFSFPGEVYPDGDWHFNEIAHPRVADGMFSYIKKKLDQKKNCCTCIW